MPPLVSSFPFTPCVPWAGSRRERCEVSWVAPSGASRRGQPGALPFYSLPPPVLHPPIVRRDHNVSPLPLLLNGLPGLPSPSHLPVLLIRAFRGSLCPLLPRATCCSPAVLHCRGPAGEGELSLHAILHLRSRVVLHGVSCVAAVCHGLSTGCSVFLISEAEVLIPRLTEAI